MNLGGPTIEGRQLAIAAMTEVRNLAELEINEDSRPEFDEGVGRVIWLLDDAIRYQMDMVQFEGGRL